MTSFEDDRDRKVPVTTSFQDDRDRVPEWTPGDPSMTGTDLETYERTTAALRARTAALLEDGKRLETENDEMRKQRLEIEARTERMIVQGAKRAYQTEIHGVAINVLVSILTKDALKGMRESEFAEVSKIDIGQMVDFSLMVAKRYIDELHRISVSDKKIAEYKDQIQSQMMPGAMPPVVMPPE